MNKKNEEFFNQILLEMSAPVETMIKRLCRDPGLAEDIMQDIFLEIYKNWPSMKIIRDGLFLRQRINFRKD